MQQFCVKYNASLNMENEKRRTRHCIHRYCEGRGGISSRPTNAILTLYSQLPSRHLQRREKVRGYVSPSIKDSVRRRRTHTSARADWS